MLSNAWIIAVWEDDDVLPLIAATCTTSKFRPGMMPTTAKASQSTAAAQRAIAACRSASALCALMGITLQGLLSLARVRPYNLWHTSRNCPSMKCLGQSHCLPCNALDSENVVLGLLSGLKHGLKGLPLMGVIQQLDDAVLREIPAVICLKANIQSILEAGAQAHWEVSLTREGASCTHELSEVSLNRADNLISVAIRIHLADMIDGCVRLHGVARAQLKKHGVPKRSRREPNNPAFIVGAHFEGVSSGGGEIKF